MKRNHKHKRAAKVQTGNYPTGYDWGMSAYNFGRPQNPYNPYYSYLVAMYGGTAWYANLMRSQGVF